VERSTLESCPALRQEHQEGVRPDLQGTPESKSTPKLTHNHQDQQFKIVGNHFSPEEETSWNKFSNKEIQPLVSQ